MLIRSINDIPHCLVEIFQNDLHLVDSLAIHVFSLLDCRAWITRGSGLIVPQSELFKALFSLGTSKQLLRRISPRSIAGENPIRPSFASDQVGPDIVYGHAVAAVMLATIETFKEVVILDGLLFLLTLSEPSSIFQTSVLGRKMNCKHIAVPMRYQ